MASENLTTPSLTNGTSDFTHQNATAPPFSHPVLMTLYNNWGVIYMSARITSSAMAIIWVGSLSSLRRPPSAAPAEDRKKDKDGKAEKEDRFTEGFAASDAIMMPLLASVVLVGLYYLIKWMEDPDLLNKIIRGYMSVMSLASMGKLAADALQIVTSLVLPTVWADRAGRLYKISGARRQQLLTNGDASDEAVVTDKTTPLPGFLSAIKLPAKANNLLWTVRHLLMEEWTLRAALHGLGSAKVTLKLNDMLGFNIGLVTIITYYLTGWSSLSNVLGTAFCYMTFSLMSPTSFAIGTAVLSGLFVYDIVMVFYTPYMVTVATKLDVPIKLVFQNAVGHDSILGLGDIVLPGIFIALALRFDLWRYYNSKIKLVPTELATELKTEASDDTPSGQDPAATVTQVQTQHRAVKQPFVSPSGQWGNRFWTHGLVASLFSAPSATPALVVAGFPKTYFHMAMLGYLVGMLLTMAVLVVFQHGQPALLYLVPCVTGAVWLTGAARGELGLLWRYTEDGSLDTQDVVVETDARGNVLREVGGKTLDEIEKEEEEKEKEKEKGATLDGKKAGGRDDGYAVFLLSLVAPREQDLKDE